ncbi:hypothetical protein APR41_02770 [Salegentibacter salinarum]|uniref:AsmA domain-containing protein n=1 Tax=Salegentibacter salinarum TaxID=447422 RepID=A0A2N0U4I7_9FLAO|nr:hypothetical protein [Salegentibacter salinarum]PKD21919.1 hypothetical protein APR41_02770 [Salegentibacter salinarum]SKB32084.1 hypothetical protein SAMN05660903_00005 [Salegentibacter salinarum]
MKKKSKLFLSFIVILIVLAIAIIGGNMFIESKMETALEENLKKAEFKYEDLNASLLGRSVSISNPVYKKNGMQINAEEIKLDGIDIFEYLSNNNIEIRTLKLTKPEVAIYTEAEKEKDTSEGENSTEIDLLIKSVEVVDGDFKMAKSDSVKEQLLVNIPSLNLKDVSVDQKSLKNGLPFNYKDLQMTSDSLFFNLNDLHDMYVEKMEMKGSSLVFSNIKMKPLYDKQEFQKHIPYEKDRFDLSLGELTLQSFNWSFKNDSLSIESENTEITNGDIKIYRDKQVKDDPRQKPMYSKMIRELPFKLKVDTLKVDNLAIQYEELVKPKRGPGKVTFKNLNASIYNISNVNMDAEDFPRTDIDVQTQFMGEASLNVNWNFDISNKADVFSISGQMDKISSEGINQFMEPALNVKAEGGIRDMRFNFTGNNQNSSGDMKLVYKDFKVEVLQSDGEEENKLFSAIANLFINNDATSAEKEQKDIQTERTQNKSFWNYLWKNVRNGALKSFL